MSRTIPRARRSRSYQVVKRLLDATTAVALLVLLAPVFLVLAGLIYLSMGRPIFFRQPRAGYRGKPFTLVKFRTMRESRNATGKLLSDSERLTGVGRFLRRLSLDELPQLWNVLRGEMSFVGPRPLLVDYLPRYTPRQRRRHEVPPGITGWAQVNGRNEVDWEQKFELDVWYVDHASMPLDAWILWRTVGVALSARGVSAAEHATMPEFLGNSTTLTPPENQPSEIANAV